MATIQIIVTSLTQQFSQYLKLLHFYMQFTHLQSFQALTLTLSHSIILTVTRDSLFWLNVQYVNNYKDIACMEHLALCSTPSCPNTEERKTYLWRFKLLLSPCGSEDMRRLRSTLGITQGPHSHSGFKVKLRTAILHLDPQRNNQTHFISPSAVIQGLCLRSKLILEKSIQVKIYLTLWGSNALATYIIGTKAPHTVNTVNRYDCNLPFPV